MLLLRDLLIQKKKEKKRNTTASPRLNSQLSPYPYHTQFNRNFSPFVSFQSRVFVPPHSSKSFVWFGLIRIVESHPTVENPEFSGKPNQSQINGRCVGMCACLSICVCLRVCVCLSVCSVEPAGPQTDSCQLPSLLTCIQFHEHPQG